MVTWDSNGGTGGDTSSYSLQGQRYDANGSTVGSEFQVNTTTTTNQVFSAVAAIEDGDFVVVWRSDASACSDVSPDPLVPSPSIQG